MATERVYRHSITKVWAKNFRSIEHAELELGPLTVLVGPNASGKSNLLDIPVFLADATLEGLELAITKRGGIDSIGRRSPTGRALSPEIGFQYESPEGILEYGFALIKQRGKGEYRVKREFAKLEPSDPSGDRFEVELIDGRLTKPNLKQIARNAESARQSLVRIINQFEANEIGTQDLHLISEKPSLVTSLLATLDSILGSMGDESIFRFHFTLNQASERLSEMRIYHIFPNSLRAPQKAADSHPLAPNGENLASTLRNMVQKKGPFLPELKEALGVAVPGIRDIRIVSAGSYHVVELKHEKDDESKTGQWFDLSHESDGTIRLLAMLTALFQYPAPSLIGLEEPELAIHPGAMAVLADTMKEASLRGQVLVSTHSPDLINLLPLDSIRAVTAKDGSTKVGRVAEHQLKSVRDNLFLPGELHSMEGLQPAGAGKSTE